MQPHAGHALVAAWCCVVDSSVMSGETLGLHAMLFSS